MKFITDKVKWTESMKEYAEDVITKKLIDYTNDYSQVNVRLNKLKNDLFKISLTLKDFRVQAIHTSFYVGMNDAATKLRDIIHKYNKKYITNKKHNKSPMCDNLAEKDSKDFIDNLISKEKIFELEPQSIDEALQQFDQTDYSFYVFKDIDFDNVVSIIYRRLDKTYGIIRCR